MGVVAHNCAMFSLGYLLVRAVPRPPYVSAELIPETVVSASVCISPQFPGPNALSWVIASDEERADALASTGLPAARHEEAIVWATAAHGSELGWPSVCRSAAVALVARERFFPNDEAMRVIGLGLPQQFVDDFIAQATPPQSPPQYAPMGKSGHLEALEKREPLAPGGRLLGFEPVNLELWSLDHSWLCNGLEVHCAGALNIRPAANGLLATLDEAIRCRNEIARGEVGAEPGPWYPVELREY